MINYSNIIRHDNIDFADYLKIGGYSHSWLKHQRNGICPPMIVTDNMKIGSMVDNILTEPHKVDLASHFYPFCKQIVFTIKERFGSMIDVFQKQVSYTANVTYDAFTMPTTGRLDFLLPGHAVIDLKCSKSKIKDIPTLIEFMGYENQIWHYCKMSKVDKAYLMVYSIPDKRTEIYFYDCSNNYNTFWSNKCIEFGKVKETINDTPTIF